MPGAPRARTSVGRRLFVPRARMGKLPAPLLADAQMPMAAMARPSGAPQLCRMTPSAGRWLFVARRGKCPRGRCARIPRRGVGCPFPGANGQIARAATGACPNAHGGNGLPIRRTEAVPDDAEKAPSNGNAAALPRRHTGCGRPAFAPAQACRCEAHRQKRAICPRFAVAASPSCLCPPRPPRCAVRGLPRPSAHARRPLCPSAPFP